MLKEKFKKLIDFNGQVISKFNSNLHKLNEEESRFYNKIIHSNLKVLPKTTVLDEMSTAPAGTVLRAGPEGVDVACGVGVLRLSRLQAPGRNALDVGAFLAGFPLDPGTRFAAVEPGP